MLWRALAVALLAVTAGCGTFATVNEPTPTVTPVPVTDVKTETSTPTGIAPGLSGGGVRNVSRLAEAHTEAIEGSTYVWRSTRRIDRLPDSIGTEHTVKQKLVVESERRYRYHTNRRDVHSRGDERLLNDVSEFADGKTVYARFVPFSDQEFSYDSDPAEPASEAYAREMTVPIRQYLAVPDAAVAEARVDGQLYYQVESERADVPGINGGTNFSVTALVSRRGFVRSMNVSYELDRGTRVESVQYSFRYDRRDDVTVERPGWVNEHWSTDTTASDRLYPGRTVENVDGPR